MTQAHTIPTSVASLVGTSVVDEKGNACGKVQEFAVDVGKDSSRVAGFVLQLSGENTMLPIESVVLGNGSGKLKATAEPEPVKSLNDYLLLERDLLDQQIIDVDGRKVVRVNDVNLEWDLAARGAVKGLLIKEVEVGTRGASRRLFKGLPAGAVESIATKFKARVIPWDCVDLIDRDPARTVKLKIGRDRLSKLHPSDIADILEELAPAEREAVFTSLPEETAAETLEEIEPKLQKALVTGLDSERAADIIEEMDPGAAADLLNELSDEQSEAILEEMEPEERQDVEELLEFSPDTAAGLMTTDFISVSSDATVADAIELLRAFEGDPDTITEIYLLGEDETLTGVVMLPRLVLAKHATKLATLWEGHIVSCGLQARDREVAELFDKYNLRSLPVVDHHGRIAGAIHAEQVIAQLRER